MAENSVTVTALVLGEDVRLSMGDLCRTCGISADYVFELVDVGLLEPIGGEPAQWLFAGCEVPRVLAALRLQRDLDLNLAGAVLALELLDETRMLRTRVRELERLLGI